MAEWNSINYEFLNLGESLKDFSVYKFYSDDDQLKTLFLKGYDDFYGNGERVRWPDNITTPNEQIITALPVTKALSRVLNPGHKINFCSNWGYYEKAPRAKKIIRTGKTNLNNGMFMVRDKIPFISYIHKLDGVLLPEAKIILEGSNNKVVVSSDVRGIIAEYIAADTYTNATIISRNNIVYKLTSLENIDDNEYMFRMKVKRMTKANVPYRQIHRNFS